MTPKPGHQRLLLIFLLAVVIRLAGIASRPIWYDEAFSILISEQGPSAILAGTISTDADASAAEEHPPAYYFTLWGWMKLFGNSLSSARALSIIASLGIVLLAHLIAREFFHESAALAALFAVILPFQVHYAQEIRMYVFLAFWLTLAAYALIKNNGPYLQSLPRWHNIPIISRQSILFFRLSPRFFKGTGRRFAR